MSSDSPRKKGYLYKLPVKGLVKKWIKRWFVLYATTHEGVVRIEYYDSPEYALNGIGKRTIPLRDCTGLSTAAGNKIHPYVFQFRSQIGHHVLAAESQPDMEEWMECIKQVVQEDRLKRRRTKTQSMVIASSSDASSDSFNDSGLSYKNKVDSGTYRVTVEENETSKKMNLSGTYNLELTPTSLTLTAPSRATIFTLSYKFLKNYGKQSGQFNFETGKNSPIGEGKLILVTTCSKEIFGVVHNNIKKLKEKIQGTQPGHSLNKAPPPPKQQQKKSTEATRNPRPSIGSGGSNRPGSRHSSEITNSSVAGTYRTSRDMEEAGRKGTSGVDSPSRLYSTVDKSTKSAAKQRQQQKKQQKTDKTTEEPLYSDPFEADPAYRAPPIPSHGRDSRASYALVEIDDNAFFDSFDDDDGDEGETNLKILTEGVSNPFDSSGFNPGDSAAGNGANSVGQPVPQDPVTPATSQAPLLSSPVQELDFGSEPSAENPSNRMTSDTANTHAGFDTSNFTDFDFNFGGGMEPLPNGSGDPFSAEAIGPGKGGMADFDLGTLDANFFEKLEAMEVKDQSGQMNWGEPAGLEQQAWGAAATAGNETLNKEEFDQFWSNMDANVPKFQ